MTQALPIDALLLAEVFDKVPSAIIVLDEQGCVKRANQSASKLLGLEALENERWVELVSKVFRPRQDDGHEISTKDGRRLQVITLDLQQGQLIQMTDLTQTRALQDKIAHMERLSSLGKMAASLAHQIRTPLSAAMLYAANLGNANLQPMARKRFQEKLMGRLEALEAQVSDILMFARSNEQTVTEIDASQLVDQTASNVSAVLTKGDAELETISDAGEMPILGNATALTGALSNLVANAVEAGANKIILKLTKDEEQNTITFSVANNGPAIPEELKQKIFEPFFTSKSSGTGLGLAVVTAVTKVHQGTLKLESWGAEYATVFSITIPLYTPNHVENTSLANTVSSLRASLENDEEVIIGEDSDEPQDNASNVTTVVTPEDAILPRIALATPRAAGNAPGASLGANPGVSLGSTPGASLGANSAMSATSAIASASVTSGAAQATKARGRSAHAPRTVALASPKASTSKRVSASGADDDNLASAQADNVAQTAASGTGNLQESYPDSEQNLGQDLEQNPASNSSALGMGVVNSGDNIAKLDGLMGQGAASFAPNYEAGYSAEGYAYDDEYAGEYAEDEYNEDAPEEYSDESYEDSPEYDDTMRSLGLGSGSAKLATLGRPGASGATTKVPQVRLSPNQHKRGQIGAANAVLVAAVQRPK